MSRWVVALIIVSAIIILLETYAFQAIKTLTKSKIVQYSWLLVSLLVYANFFYVILTSDRGSGQTIKFQWAVGLFLLVLVPKLVVLLLMFGEDVVRLAQKGFSFFSKEETKDLAGRRAFVSKIALGLAALPFASMLYGMVKGKYNYKVLKYQLSFKDLPKAFDGFTISHITDIHSGSFDNHEKIQYGVDLINEQQSDMILFTGDMVNNFAHEMDDWVSVFSQLKAPKGMFSVFRKPRLW